MQTHLGIYLPAVTFQHPAPAQIIPQVVGCDSMESFHPLLQPPVISVHMLDVVCPNDSLTSTVVHHLMCYAPRLAETGIHPCTITAEHCIGRDEWLQHRFHRLRIQPFQLKVGLMARPVPRVRPFPPRCLAGRGNPRCPLNDSRKKVSSTSTMPSSRVAWWFAIAFRKR